MPVEMSRASSLQVALTLVGTVVGAGFASGQEILRFFVVFGRSGVIGLLVSGILLVLLSSLIIVSAARFQVYSHKDLIQQVMPHPVGTVYDTLLAFLLLVSTSIMFAGSGAVFRQQFGWHELFGIALMVMLVLISSQHIQSVIGLNVLLVPFLILAVVFLGVRTALASASDARQFVLWRGPLLRTTKSWFDSAILYSFYNMFLSLSGLSSIGGAVSVRAGRQGAVLGAVIITVLLVIAAFVLWGAGSGIIAYPVPLLAEAFRINSALGVAYSLVILAAMLTTAVVNVYGLARRLEETFRWPHWVSVAWVLAAAIPLSYAGFTEVLSVAYPLIGYGAFIFFLFWMVSGVVRLLSRVTRFTR